jgi:hypothetical protein
MVERKRLMIVILFLTTLIIMGFANNVSSQQGPETSKTPTGQKQPVERQPFQNRFQWQAGLEVIADLSADKLTYTGVCPTIVTFKGSIYTNRAMTVHYRFLRSDDVRTIPVALKLGKDEKKEVTYSWEVGGTNESPEFNGWVFLQVIYPTNMKIVSNVVNFKGNCTHREDKSAEKETKGQNLFSQQQGQKVPGPPSTGSLAQLPGARGPVPAGPPMIQQGQAGQPVTGGPASMSPSQGGQGPGSMPMPQPGQTGQGPGGMPMPQPGQKGPMPGESPMLPGTGKGPIPGSTSMPLLNQQGQAIALKEDCISFNPDTTTMEQISFGWRIMDGSQIIFGFDFDKTEATIALATIKHYKMTQSCFVGRPRPTFHYMLAGGSSPVGSFRPTDCSPFNPATTNVKQMNGSWKVADGGNGLFDFGEKKEEADQTLAIIKKYGFTYSCMIAKGKVEYIYMHK